MNMHNTPALQRSLRELVEEYNAKKEALPQVVKDYASFHTGLDMACTVGGTYVGRVVDYHPSLSVSRLEANLLESAWRHVYQGLNIHRIATAADRSRFDLDLKTPPEFTLDNLRATFGGYLQNPRHHILKGLAECFVDLDPAYKSHSKIKIGVEGLPKKIIISHVTDGGEYGWSGYGENQLRDTINALNTVQGDPQIGHGEFSDLVKLAWRGGKAEYKGLTLKVFKNGNGHLIFSKHKLQQVNEALAEFYGDVLPDAPEENAKKRPGTDVSTDLQFYPTPAKVVGAIMTRSFHARDDGEGRKLLEPSCGEGAMMDQIRSKYPKLTMVGVEVHGKRADTARAKGHAVLTANFLQVRPHPVYDYVLMNPPFYGLHWQKHLLHAIKFLRPPNPEKLWDRGMLFCILPATAFYDGHLGEMGLIPKDAHTKHNGWRDTGWHDLPVASFAESGTNVPTGYLVYGAKS